MNRTSKNLPREGSPDNSPVSKMTDWRFAHEFGGTINPDNIAMALQVYARWLIRAARSASISDRSKQSDAPALTSATPDCTVSST